MIIDITVLIIILVSAVIAFLRGFIREILTIFGTLGAFAAAYMFGGALTPLIEGFLGVHDGESIPRLFGILPYDLLAKGIAYASIFIIVIVSLSLLSHFIAESVKSMGLGAIDRTFGFIFGLVRGVFIIALLYLPIHIFVEQDSKDKWFESSTTHFYIEKTSALLANFLPEDAAETAKTTAEELESSAQGLDKANEVFNSLKPNTPNDQSEPANQNGYDNDQRDTLDQLFEMEISPDGETSNSSTRTLNE